MYNLAEMDISEDEKILLMMKQSASFYGEDTYVQGIGPIKPPPDTYICHRCNKKGHWKQHCQEKPDPEAKRKNPTGIPSSFLKPTVGDNKWAMKNEEGYVAPSISITAYSNPKKERGPLFGTVNLIKVEEKKIPDKLKCMLCSELMIYAAIIPCCKTSFCDECIRDALLDSPDFDCPNCKESGVLPDGLEASTKIRKAIIAFENGEDFSLIDDTVHEDVPEESEDVAILRTPPRLPQSEPTSPGTPVLDERPEYYKEEHHIRRLQFRHYPYARH